MICLGDQFHCYSVTVDILIISNYKYSHNDCCIICFLGGDGGCMEKSLNVQSSAVKIALTVI